MQLRTVVPLFIITNQICQAADIWKENDIQLAAPGSIPARSMNKSHKCETVMSGDPLLPIVNEDLVDALLDSPWITTADSDSESEEEQSCVVAQRCTCTSRPSTTQNYKPGTRMICCIFTSTLYNSSPVTHDPFPLQTACFHRVQPISCTLFT